MAGKSYVTQHEKSPNSEFFWSVFCRIWINTEIYFCGSPYLFRYKKKKNNKDKKPLIILVPSDQWNSPTLSKSRFQKKSKLNLGQILTKTNSKKLNFLLKMNLLFFSSFLLSFYLHVLWGLYICIFSPRFFQLLLL